MGLKARCSKRLAEWLNHEYETQDVPLCDFDRLAFEARPCDVLLVEGRSRVSQVIKTITQSIWTHSAIYVGRLHDIDDPELRKLVVSHYDGDPNTQLLIEPILGKGTIVTPLEAYRGEHLRICRPKGLSRPDIQAVIKHVVLHLGVEYDFRQMLDLARFLFPYSILPRRWRSTLFEHNAGFPTKTVCSSMIASAFNHVHYPILPVIHKEEDGHYRLYKRNTRLYKPSDYDCSPYFEIVKYPFMGFDDLAVYRQLPWDDNGLVCNAKGDCFVPPSPGEDTAVGR
ncbi:hypothetical protein MNBD_GAMMA18-1931 [hydrothermal vent metagenome]|uniref:Lipo-like protein n=1 Tax=hydrothermal vent metagenome TaxID=652676 RepID=A0A3B0ZVV8_9ZZZZ